MTLSTSQSLRLHGVVLVVHWLVLVVFMFGTIVSSIGGMSSHGLAAIAATLLVTQFPSDESHEHVPEAEDTVVVNHSAGADHTHHGADHSHDKVHALPAGWRSSAPQLPGWVGQVRPWTEMIQASRLERPPMG